MRRLLNIAAVLLLAASCNLAQPAQWEAGRRNIQFEIVTPYTRSSLPVQDSRIMDMNLFAYTDGHLDACDYCLAGGQLELELKTDTDYNLYALANAGRVEAPYDEDELEVLTLMLDGLSSLEEAFPMSWSERINTANTRVIKITLERLVSRIGFNMDKSLLCGLEVTSVRLRQSALDFRPFSDGSAAVFVADGDYASAEDLESVNSGGTVYFYALENAKGDLLRGNSDPWQKTPENVGYEADCCTYLEVECNASSVPEMSGSVVYRMFIGTDNCSNFDLLRNHGIVITLKATKDGFGVESWKIDTSRLSVEEYMEFMPPSITTRYGRRDTVLLNTNVKNYRVEVADFEELGLSYERIGNGFIVDCRCWYAGGGTAFLNASGGNCSASCRINVDNRSDGISVPDDMILLQGTKRTVTIMPTPIQVDFHYMCECQSSNLYVADITDVLKDTYEISALHPGTCVMTALFEGMTASFNVTVTEARVPISDFEVPQYLDVPFGGSAVCNLTIVPSNATDEISLHPEDESLVSFVNMERGKYMAYGLRAGKTLVHAVTSGGLEKSFVVYVTTEAEFKIIGGEVTLCLEDAGQGRKPLNIDAVAILAAQTNYTDDQDNYRTDRISVPVDYECRLSVVSPGDLALPAFSRAIDVAEEEIKRRYEDNYVWTDIVAGYYYITKSYYYVTGISFTGSRVYYDDSDFKIVMRE